MKRVILKCFIILLTIKVYSQTAEQNFKTLAPIFIDEICYDGTVIGDSTSSEKIMLDNIMKYLPLDLKKDSSFNALIEKHNNLNSSKIRFDPSIEMECDYIILHKTSAPSNIEGVDKFWQWFNKKYPNSGGITYFSNIAKNDKYALIISSSYQSGSAGESLLFIFKLTSEGWKRHLDITRWSN